MNSIRKSIILALVIICGSVVANAQFRFGLKAGLNLNSLHLSNLSDNLTKDNGCGFTGGVMAEFQVPVVGICFDASLMYTHMTAKTDVIENDANGNVVDDNISPSKNFLEIPINLKYKIGIIPAVQPYIFTGPSFAFKLGGDENVFKTRTFQTAWNIGVGVELLKHLQIGGSYGFGMNNILKNTGLINNTSNNIKLKNNYWTITAAYLF